MVGHSQKLFRIVLSGKFPLHAKKQMIFSDFQQTQFGGWPWDRHDQVHAKDAGRFAKYRDGREERPENAG
jgi:hypothetical protein